MKLLNEPQAWVIQVSWPQIFAHDPEKFTMMARNVGTNSIKYKIHHLPGYRYDLVPKGAFSFDGETNLINYLGWCDKVCPDRGRVREKLVDEYLEKCHDFEIWCRYRPDDYQIEVKAKEDDLAARICEDLEMLKAEPETNILVKTDRGHLVKQTEGLEKMKMPKRVKKEELKPKEDKDKPETPDRELEINFKQPYPGRKQKENDLSQRIEVYQKEVRALQTAFEKGSQTWEEEKNHLRGQIEKILDEVAGFKHVVYDLQRRLDGMVDEIEKAGRARKEMIEAIDRFQNSNLKRLQGYRESRVVYQELLKELRLGAEIPEELSDLEQVLQELSDLQTRVEKMSGLEFVSCKTEIQKAYDQWVRKAQEEVRWDSLLIALLNRLRGERPIMTCLLSEGQIERLRCFSEGKGFTLIWPNVGEALVMREHRILSEEKVEGVERGRVALSITPGLRRGEEVIVKACIVLGR